MSLRPLSLEDLLPADHRARFVWSFAERLDLSTLYGAIKAVEGHPGHPPADPRILLALWLYATAEGVGSARELDRLCREHIGFEWLCGGVGVNHTTLAEFRVAHGAVLERLLIDSFAAMLKTGHASLERVAQDGMRVRAAAGAASFRRRASLERCPRRSGGRGRPSAGRARRRSWGGEPKAGGRSPACGGGPGASCRSGAGRGWATRGEAARRSAPAERGPVPVRGRARRQATA